MGEQTPEAVEIKCPGCSSYFRLRPKKGRLPTGDVPCPKCSESIPVKDGKVSLAEPQGSTRLLRTDEEQAIAHLEKMAALIPGDASSTFAGLPGNFDPNPFATSRGKDRTAAVDRSVLRQLASTSSVAEDDEEVALAEAVRSPRSSEWAASRRENTSPINSEQLDQLAAESSEAVVDDGETTESSEDSGPASARRRELRDTRENQTIARSLAKANSESREAPQKAQVLARIKKKTREVGRNDVIPEKTSPALSTSRLRAALNKSRDEQDTSEEVVTEASEDKDSEGKAAPSLAALFKKARTNRDGSADQLRKKLQTPAARKGEGPSEKRASEDEGLAMDLSDGELDAIVERTTSGAGIIKPAGAVPARSSKEESPPVSGGPPELPAPKAPPARKAPVTVPQLPRSEAPPSKEKAPKAPGNAGLFAHFEDSSPTGAAGIGEVSSEKGQNTTQSMLARLQKRRNREDVDDLQVGAASERRGSGYIRLPTAEIQSVLGQGEYRLRIQDVIYEPVDEKGLTQLIKSGVLMGAEEIAEADGDWMPVVDHPVFGELRRKMAAEAHEVLAKIGATQRMHSLEKEAPATEPPAEEPAPKEEALTPPHQEDPLRPEAAVVIEDEIPSVPSTPEAPSAPVEREAAEVLEAPQAPEPASIDPPAEPRPARIATPAGELLEPPKSKKKTGLFVGGAAALLALAAAGVFFSPLGESLLQAEAAVEKPAAEELAEVDDGALIEAIATAQRAVTDAVPTAFSDPKSARQWASDRVGESVATDVLVAEWNAGKREEEFLLLLLDALLQSADYHTARRVALTGRELYPQTARFPEAHLQAIREDEALTGYAPVTISDPAAFTAAGLYHLSSHRGIVLQEADSGRRLVFKPERNDAELQWRIEVAAWRLCELIACHFTVLKVEPAIVTRAALENLAGDTAGLEGLLAQVRWQTLEVDGQEVEAVWGSLEEAPETTPPPFPIEFRPLWTNWLTVGTDTSALEQPVSQNLVRLQTLAEGRFFEGLEQTIGTLETGELARQVSSLLLFDFLTNNWERFFTRAEDYGTNNPVIAGRLASLHNGDAFQPRASRRVQGRFEWTTRFSRSTVETLRTLDQELVATVLFPEATGAERARLDMMWSQRNELLQRVDALVARHGEDDVLLFP